MTVKDPKTPNLVPINGSTNVYVGQRYVPKFYDDGTEQHGATWDKTKVYEPLTIVLWKGDSYTSRTFVPSGVEITDTKYWLRTGVFNAQLETINLNLNSAAASTIANTTRLNRRYIIFGDSYAQPEVGWSYGGYLKSNLKITDHKQFYNFAVGGAAYSGQPNTYSAQLNKAISTVEDPDTITDILVIGGHNEVSNMETINGAMMAFYDTAIAHFKHARIYSVFAGANTVSPAKRTQLYTTELAYSTSIRPFANVDCAYILYSSKQYMSSDGVHPSTIGTMWACRIITSAINGGSDDLTTYSSVSFTLDQGYTCNQSRILAAFNKSIVTLYSSDITFRFPSTSSKEWVKIGSITSTLGLGLDLSEGAPVTGSTINLAGFIKMSNDSYEPATIQLGFAAGNLYLRCKGPFAGTYKEATAYGITQSLNMVYFN